METISESIANIAAVPAQTKMYPYTAPAGPPLANVSTNIRNKPVHNKQWHVLLKRLQECPENQVVR